MMKSCGACGTHLGLGLGGQEFSFFSTGSRTDPFDYTSEFSIT